MRKRKNEICAACWASPPTFCPAFSDDRREQVGTCSDVLDIRKRDPLIANQRETISGC